MKNFIEYIIIVFILLGCADKDNYSSNTPNRIISEEILTSPLEVSVESSITKTFDENLVWSWSSSDKIMCYQVAGGNTVNSLYYTGDNKFGTSEFFYSSNDATTFHFVYEGEAILDISNSGVRGIRQNSSQSGELTPILVGSTINKTFDEIMDGETNIVMEYLSSALEIRVWKEGIDKQNITGGDYKYITSAELISDKESLLVDVVPTYNQNGTIIYTEREKNEEQETYIKVDDIYNYKVVFNIAPHIEKYKSGDLKLTLTDEYGNKITTDLPALSFGVGERTILNVEWKSPTSANLPEGSIFNTIICDYLSSHSDITNIKFITNSKATSDDILIENSIYLIPNKQTLEIHTYAGKYVAHSNSANMFNGNNTLLSYIVDIDFGDNFFTSEVTNMESIFNGCINLTSLNLSSFSFEGNPKIDNMFNMVGYNVDEKPINVYVRKKGKNYIEGQTNSGLNGDHHAIYEYLGLGEWYDKLCLSTKYEYGIQKVIICKSENDHFLIINPYGNTNQLGEVWGSSSLGGAKNSIIEFWILENGLNVAWDDWWCPGILYNGAGTDLKAYLPSVLGSSLADEDAKSKFYEEKVVGFYPYWYIDGLGGFGTKYPCFLSLPGGPILENWLKDNGILN